MVSQAKMEAAWLKVLDEWSWSPEELGAAVEVAITRLLRMDYSDIKKFHTAASEKYMMRNRILGCEGGKELLEIEEALKYPRP